MVFVQSFDHILVYFLSRVTLSHVILLYSVFHCPLVNNEFILFPLISFVFNAIKKMLANFQVSLYAGTDQ